MRQHSCNQVGKRFMKYKLYLLLLFVLTLITVSEAQAHYGIQRAFAFRTISPVGNIGLGGDDEVAPAKFNISYNIFIETKGNYPTWTSAVINGVKYSVKTTETKSAYKAGIYKSTQKNAVVNISKGNRLWKLELEPVNSNAVIRSGKYSVVLTGKYNRKHISYRISKVTDLETPEIY